MQLVDSNEVQPRSFPARRQSKNLVGGQSPIRADNFNMGRVVLEPLGGQVPWHNHEQEEIYYLLSGTGEICIGNEIETVSAGYVVYIPSGEYHQLTNMGEAPLEFIYCYAPAGDVAHWKQELAGTLPIAGVDAPNLPLNATRQFIA